MGTCCSKDESDKLEAIETKVRPKRHACPDMSKHVRILDKFLSPRVLTCWQRCIVSYGSNSREPWLHYYEHDCYRLIHIVVTHDEQISTLLFTGSDMSHLSHHRALDFAEDSVPTAPETVVVEANRSWNLGTLGDLECALHRVHHVHCRPHCKPHSHKMSQRQSKAIKGLKFEDWCILTFKEPSSQISHSGDLLGKKNPRGELQKKR